MSKKKYRQKHKEERSARIEISDIIKSLQLPEKDMEELEIYLNQDKCRPTNDSLAKILTDEKMTISQKMFLSYMRGLLYNPSNYMGVKSGKFLDIGAAEEFADSMYSSDIHEKFMKHVLSFASKTMELNIEDIELALKETVDDNEIKIRTSLLEDLKKSKALFDEDVKEYETEVDTWKHENKTS